MSVIEITDIHKVYKMGDTEVRALNGVSLKVDPGEFVAIMGPSGSGKSTMLQILGLLDTPDSGSYKLLGREVSTLKEDELAAVRSQTLGFVFQMFNLLSRTSALENTSLPLLYSDAMTAHGDPKQILAEVGLGDRMHHKPNELSGGQQQRVAIARSLINKPRMILADEPTGNLDSRSSEEIIQLLKKMNDSGITVVMVTHETDIAAHAKRVIHMKDGKILSDETNSPPREEVPVPAGKPGAQADFTFHSTLNFRQVREYFRQAFRSLLSNKVRTGLSVLGILMGVAAVVVTLALGAGSQKSIEKQFASLGTNLLMLRSGSIAVGGVQQGSGSTSRITFQDAEEVAKVPMIKRVAPEISGQVQVTYSNKNWSTQVTGTTPPYAFIRSAQPIYGRFISQQDVQKRNRVALLGLTVIKNLFGDNVNPIGENIKINRINFQVIGVLPVKGASGNRDQDDAIVVPVTTAMYRLLGKEYVNMVDIEVDNPENIAAVTAAVKSFMMKLKRVPDLPGNENAFQVRNPSDFQAALTGSVNVVALILAVVAGVCLVVGGIGIMNIMLVSVTERTREIGLRKAIGARRRDILSQFLIESVAVSLAGGIMGIALGWGVTLTVSMVTGWETVVSLNSILMSSGFSIVVGMVFGIWPAYKASRLSPIMALRYE